MWDRACLGWAKYLDIAVHVSYIPTRLAEILQLQMASELYT